MWLARLSSRGRAGYPRDPARAQAIAEQLVGAVQRQAAAGTVEAMFLIGSAYDEGLGVDEDPALIAVRRTFEDGALREAFRTLHPRGGHKPMRAFTFLEVEGEEEQGETVDLATLAKGERNER